MGLACSPAADPPPAPPPPPPHTVQAPAVVMAAIAGVNVTWGAYEAGTVTYSLASKRNPGASRREVRVRSINVWQMTPQGRWLIRRSLRTE